MFKNRTILITGGTGSWGNELTRQLLLQAPKEIRIYSRGELNQVSMQRKFQSNNLRFIIGDIRDYTALKSALQGVDFVFHLAALKHVPVCEAQPLEAIKTNIKGTENVIEAAIQNDVQKVIDISTDKAVSPINIYGMTKSIGERLMLQANEQNHHTRFLCIRGGNVLGTNGSVVPYFKKQILDSSSITLTDHRMTRFFLTVQQAIHLLFHATIHGLGGETFVLKMPACKIIDIASVLIESLNKPDTIISETGIRPGEKLHEELISEHESKNAFEFGDSYYVLLGSHPAQTLADYYLKFPRVAFSKYQSNDKLMQKKEIADMLKNGGFL